MHFQNDPSTAQLIPNGVATLEVFYYMPDHPSLLAQSFVWQTLDYYPIFPRVRRFLDHWREDIEAVIREINLSHDLARAQDTLRIVTETFTIQ